MIEEGLGELTMRGGGLGESPVREEGFGKVPVREGLLDSAVREKDFGE